MDVGGRARQEANWRARIDAVKSAPEVVQLCVRFLSYWTPHRRAGLPESCQPPFMMREPGDVADYALRLTRARLAEDTRTPELEAMCGFFIAASTRLSQLLVSQTQGMRVPFFLKD